MSQPLTGINAVEKRLSIEVLESELARVKDTTPMSAHKLAVERYKADLIKLLKKLNPSRRYW